MASKMEHTCNLTALFESNVKKAEASDNKSQLTMAKHQVKILSIDKITRDVLQIRTEKPQGFTFQSGQATEIFIVRQGWENEGRPFTFTCLPTDNFLEFTIKTYPERKGVTNQLLSLSAGDQIILNDIFGTILYQGEGTFIAGGAGVTPFISILRNLRAQNALGSSKLIFANKTQQDIIHQQEFQQILGNNFINILSEEKTDHYAHGMITKDFLQQHASLNKNFYVCGPPPMMDAILGLLDELKVKKEQIVTEAF